MFQLVCNGIHGPKVDCMRAVCFSIELLLHMLFELFIDLSLCFVTYLFRRSVVSRLFVGLRLGRAGEPAVRVAR